MRKTIDYQLEEREKKRNESFLIMKNKRKTQALSLKKGEFEEIEKSIYSLKSGMEYFMFGVENNKIPDESQVDFLDYNIKNIENHLQELKAVIKILRD